MLYIFVSDHSFSQAKQLLVFFIFYVLLCLLSLSSCSPRKLFLNSFLFYFIYAHEQRSHVEYGRNYFYAHKHQHACIVLKKLFYCTILINYFIPCHFMNPLSINSLSYAPYFLHPKFMSHLCKYATIPFFKYASCSHSCTFSY